MVRIHTRSIVALMQDMQAVWNFLVSEDPREAMGCYVASVVPNQTITCSVEGPCQTQHSSGLAFRTLAQKRALTSSSDRFGLTAIPLE